MSTWHRHRAQRNSRASSIAPPGGEGWTIRDHRAILHSEPYASADLGAASDVTSKSVQSEAASASSPTPISHQLTSDVIAGTRGARLLWQAASAQGGNNDTSQAGAVGRFSAGSLRPAQSVHEGCSPNNRAFPQPPTSASTSERIDARGALLERSRAGESQSRRRDRVRVGQEMTNPAGSGRHCRRQSRSELDRFGGVRASRRWLAPAALPRWCRGSRPHRARATMDR